MHTKTVSNTGDAKRTGIRDVWYNGLHLQATLHLDTYRLISYITLRPHIMPETKINSWKTAKMMHFLQSLSQSFRDITTVPRLIISFNYLTNSFHKILYRCFSSVTALLLSWNDVMATTRTHPSPKKRNRTPLYILRFLGMSFVPSSVWTLSWGAVSVTKVNAIDDRAHWTGTYLTGWYKEYCLK